MGSFLDSPGEEGHQSQHTEEGKRHERLGGRVTPSGASGADKSRPGGRRSLATPAAGRMNKLKRREKEDE